MRTKDKIIEMLSEEEEILLSKTRHCEDFGNYSDSNTLQRQVIRLVKIYQLRALRNKVDSEVSEE